MPLAVNVGAVATPLLLVVAVFTPPANVPPAPALGAVKVTVTPPTGLLPPSTTMACSAVPNAVLTVALCGVPAVAETLAGVPAIVVTSLAPSLDVFVSPPPETVAVFVTELGALPATFTVPVIAG